MESLAIGAVAVATAATAQKLLIGSSAGSGSAMASDRDGVDMALAGTAVAACGYVAYYSDAMSAVLCVGRMLPIIAAFDGLPSHRPLTRRPRS